MIWEALVKHGRMREDDPFAVASFLHSAEGKRLRVEAKVIKPSRTLRQNAKYWADLIPQLVVYANDPKGKFYRERLAMNEGALRPLDGDDIHEINKIVCIGGIKTPVGIIPCSSTKLDVEQFSEFYEESIALWTTRWDFQYREAA